LAQKIIKNSKNDLNKIMTEVKHMQVIDEDKALEEGTKES
jgi:hypothetical protein